MLFSICSPRMTRLQNRHIFRYLITVCYIWLHLQGVSCKPIRCRRPKDNGLVFDGKCTQCPKCPDGQGLTEFCGSGEGAGAKCRRCIEGLEFSHDYVCYQCTSCDELHRETKYLCRPDENTHCGKCFKNFYQDVALDNTIPCFSCSPHSSHRKCKKDRMPVTAEANAKFHTESHEDATVNLTVDATDQSTQQEDVSTAKVDPTHLRVIDKGTSTLRPEKNNSVTSDRDLLQNSKNDPAVIPLEEKFPGLDNKLKPYNKPKQEIYHTAMYVLMVVFALLVSISASVGLYCYSHSESHGNKRKCPDGNEKQKEEIEMLIMKKYVRDANNKVPSEKKNLLCEAEKAQQRTLSEPKQPGHKDEVRQMTLENPDRHVTKTNEFKQNAQPYCDHDVDLPPSRDESGTGAASTVVMTEAPVTLNQGCVIKYHGVKDPLEENPLKSENISEPASTVVIQETGDQNDEVDTGGLARANSEVRVVKETGDINNATAIAEPEQLDAHQLLKFEKGLPDL